MLPTDPLPDPEPLQEGKHLDFLARGKWEYVHRKFAKGVVAVLAITGDNKIILTEQFRPPLGKMVIELPAGLAGDIPYQEDEPLASAAKRELFEETGYRAEKWEPLFSGPSSAGLTDEVITIYLATQTTKMGEGGGDGSECIKVHYVPVREIIDWCREQQRRDALVDYKVFAALHLMNARKPDTSNRSIWM